MPQAGLPLSTAIDIYLNQIVLTGGIPFAVTIPQTSETINADRMTNEEIAAKLDKGYQSAMSGNAKDASAAFVQFRKGRKS